MMVKVRSISTKTKVGRGQSVLQAAVCCKPGMAVPSRLGDFRVILFDITTEKSLVIKLLLCYPFFLFKKW